MTKDETLNADFHTENGENVPVKAETTQHPRPTLTLLPLIAMIFYEVSGGPYGIEGAIEGGGPLLTIIGFLILPFLWSVPEALVTAELGTAYPANGGFVIWVNEAFGPFWGFQEGWLRWLGGVINCGVFPILFLDYAAELFSFLESGTPRRLAILIIILLLTVLNYIGLAIVGMTAVLLVFFSMSPFVALSLLAIPKLKPSRWLKINFGSVKWRLYLNTLFWNLNYWDSVSVFVAEIKNPQKTLPRGLLGAVGFVIVAYIVPTLAGIGSVQASDSDWENGYFAYVAKVISGQFLSVWIIVGAAFSNTGLYEAQMTSDSFNLLGMAEIGMIPKIFAYRSRFSTPTLGILISSVGAYGLANLSFDQLIETINFLYALGMFLQLGAFVRLRFSKPNLERPFRVPLGKVGVILMCTFPTIFLIIIICIASWKTIITGVICTLIGFILYPLMMHAKKHKWMTFEERKIENLNIPEIQISDTEDLDKDKSSHDD